MRNLDLSKVKTRKDLNDALRLLEIAWRDVSRIKDPRKRCKEIIKLKKQVQVLLYEYKSKKLLDNNEDNRFFQKVLRSIGGWLSRVDK